jgi:predicted DNA-binding WGR domain protein|tara:strand:+ start:7634 stop:8029 length:396 start_codon:yes stop_codon:yes gene_type:complete
MAICKKSEAVLVKAEGTSYKFYTVDYQSGATRWGRIGAKHVSNGACGDPYVKLRQKEAKGYHILKNADYKCPSCDKYKIGTTHNVLSRYDLHICIGCGYNHTPDDDSGMSEVSRLIDSMGGFDALMELDDL